jgi:hypothetical protein
MSIPPEDSDPVALEEHKRQGIGIIGAARILDGCLVTSRKKTFNSKTIIFLKSLF